MYVEGKSLTFSGLPWKAEGTATPYSWKLCLCILIFIQFRNFPDLTHIVDPWRRRWPGYQCSAPILLHDCLLLSCLSLFVSQTQIQCVRSIQYRSVLYLRRERGRGRGSPGRHSSGRLGLSRSAEPVWTSYTDNEVCSLYQGVTAPLDWDT